MYIDVKTNRGIETYICVDEDIDTFLVKNKDCSSFEDGFTITKRYNLEYAEILNCKVINKSQVVSLYSEYDNIYSYFGNMSVVCKDKNGYIRIETFKKPTEYASEFTYEEYDDYGRGENYPPYRSSRYYTIIDPNDKRLRRNVISHIHTEYEIRDYGIYPGIDKSEYKNKIIDYLVKKIGSKYIDDLGPLFIGSYGYRIPHYKYSTDIDLVFEKVIPRLYDFYLQSNVSEYSKNNFYRKIINAIVNIDFQLKEKYYFIINNNAINATPEYKYYMRLKAHHKLMECYKAGIEPYTKLNLTNVMYWLVHRNSEYKNKHIPVFWNDHLICADIGYYTEALMKTLLPFFSEFENNTL